MIAVSNLMYLTLDMIYHNPSLLAQAEQQYYVNKTGKSNLTHRLFVCNIN